MDVLTIIFRLGVVLAIFSFIWGLINFAFAVLRGGAPLNYPAKLALKAIQYFLIVDVVVLFSFQNNDLDVRNAIITGAIIGMYFVGKVQQMRLNFAVIQIQGRNFNTTTKPNMALEFGLIALALIFYVFLLFNMDLAENQVANWFFKSIMDIEKTFFFGFIFKVIGFFFTIAMIFRMINSLNILITGKTPGQPPRNNPYQNQDRNRRDNDGFDDYEEVE